MWRDRWADDLFHPDPATIAGIDRIIIHCNLMRDDNGLTAANVRRLRAQICQGRHCTTEIADAFSLAEADDMLTTMVKGLTKPKGASGQSSRKSRGRKPLANGTHAQKLKLDVYKRIQRERDGGLKPAKILETLKSDRDLMEQVKNANLKMSKTPLKAAFAYHQQPKRKKKEI